ncbi:MAG: VWA domain-containing protein [Myxococcales bacterium]|nr:VWA domain-containing protein [Myxococcales bacterium]
MLRRLACLLLTLAILALGRSAPAAETRLSVVLVLDASGSMAQNDPQRLVRLASKMLVDLTDERDRVTVMSFGSQVQTLHTARGDEHAALRAAIERLGRGESCTDYAQALEAAAERFAGAAPAGERRVVLFLTDGRFEPVKSTGSCGAFDQAREEDREETAKRVMAAAKRFEQAGARVFTIGLGRAVTVAQHSSALLHEVAAATRGQFVHAQEARDVPAIFAGIFGALVGAPVLQEVLDAEHPQLSFSVPGGADRLHVVLVPQAAADLDRVRLDRGSDNIPLESPQSESALASYRLARVTQGVAGTYSLTEDGRGRIDVLVVEDVGLSLRIEGVGEVVAEGEVLRPTVALRTRTGEPVHLPSAYLDKVRLAVSLGESGLFDQRPDAEGAAHLKTAPLKRGEYRITAEASHQLGFLDVEKAAVAFRVEPRFSMTIDTAPLSFDCMAEEDGLVPLTSPGTVTLVAPEDLPVDVPLAVEVPEAMTSVFDIEPRVITFGKGQPRSASFVLRFKDPRSLRRREAHFSGFLKLVPAPEVDELLVGTKAWKVTVDAHLRPWTWRRYFEEYKWHLLAGLLGLLSLIWLVGRLLAERFPEKARVYYVEVGQEFQSDSLIRRHARRGAYRSARFSFPLGKKARPLVELRAKGGRFLVTPAEGVTITILDDSLPEDQRERRTAFTGSYLQRYRLDDRYELFLARQAIEEDEAAGAGGFSVT